MSEIKTEISERAKQVMDNFINPFSSSSCVKIQFEIEKANQWHEDTVFGATLMFRNKRSYAMHEIKGKNLVDLVCNTQEFLENLDENNG